MCAGAARGWYVAVDDGIVLGAVDTTALVLGKKNFCSIGANGITFTCINSILQIVPEGVVPRSLVLHGGVPVELHAQLTAASHPGAEYCPTHTHHQFHCHEEYEEACVLETSNFPIDNTIGVEAGGLSLLLQLCQNGRSLISARGTQLCRLCTSVPLALLNDRPFWHNCNSRLRPPASTPIVLSIGKLLRPLVAGQPAAAQSVMAAFISLSQQYLNTAASTSPAKIGIQWRRNELHSSSAPTQPSTAVTTSAIPRVRRKDSTPRERADCCSGCDFLSLMLITHIAIRIKPNS
ncbi:hypothetical protein SFRURICE_017641 [Spodoptera frugiperda]|nr:hypothetical protein SFRURICE_017641 [Spodoptera frugiperda]